MDFFGLFYGDYYGGRSHWYGGREKSRHSQGKSNDANAIVIEEGHEISTHVLVFVILILSWIGREDEAKKKFNKMRSQMECSMVEAVVNEQRSAGSNSHLKDLPVDGE